MIITLVGILSILFCFATYFCIHIDKLNFQKTINQQKESFKKMKISKEKLIEFDYLLLQQKIYFDHYTELKFIRRLCLILFVLFFIASISFIYIIENSAISVTDHKLLTLFSIIMTIIIIFIIPASKQSIYQQLLKETQRNIDGILNKNFN